MRICVYGAASPTIDEVYIKTVEEMGKIMVKRGHSLVFGGGGNGLMGAVARGVRSAGGNIFGVIPKFFDDEKVEAICDFCDELVQPDTMRERKQIMEDNADAFIVVPGGIGTFEEFFEILTLRQLGRHRKPIAVLNTNDYYGPLRQMLEQAIGQGFMRPECRGLCAFFEDPETLLDYLEADTGAAIDPSKLRDVLPKA